MIEQSFMGLNNFVWWFGVVENRADPLETGRCQVRCFGWHTENKDQIPTADLPWAHPVVPYGMKAVQPPPEGTMVFGFFADGKEGRFPIIMGSVPGIPEEIGAAETGFTDPYTDAQKAASPFFPRRIISSTATANAAGPIIKNNTPLRNPSVFNEPTVSRLSRPDRVEGEDGSSLGPRGASIANTSVEFQRKNRVVYVKSAKPDPILSSSTQRVQTVWDEPFPSFNPKYPYNNATETESGHAFEMDDTQGYERVQLSHRTGSTLEFMPSGSVKQKTFNHKYDVTMGNHKSYVAGVKDETVQSDMFLRINGKLIIQCDGIDFESAGDINIKGKDVKITGSNIDINGTGKARFYGASGTEIRTEGLLRSYGGSGAVHGSGGLTTVQGSFNPVTAAVKAALKNLGSDVSDIQETSLLNCGVKIAGPNFFISTLRSSLDSVVTSILPQVSVTPSTPKNAETASKYKVPTPKFKKTTPTTVKEKTDGLSYLEKNRLGTLDYTASKTANNALTITTVNNDAMANAAITGAVDTLTAQVPQLP